MTKNFFIYLPSLLLARLGTIIVILAGANLLVPAQYGYFALIAVIGEFCEMTITNWSRIALARFGSQEEGLSRSYTIKVAKITAICSVLGIAAGDVAVRLLAPEMMVPLLVSVSFYVLAASIVRFGVVVLQTSGKRGKASSIESLRSILYLVSAMTAMYFTRDFMLTSVAGSIANLAVGIVAVYMGLKSTKLHLADNVTYKAIFKYAIPLIILAFLSRSIANVDKALLKHFHDAATLGFYAVAFSMGRSGFDIIANSYNIGGFIQLSNFANSNRNEQLPSYLSQQMASILSISIPAAGVLIALRDVIAAVIFPADYGYAFHVAVPLVALGAIALNMKNFVYDNIFHVHVRNDIQIPTLFAGAVATLVTGWFMLENWPVLGAASMFAVGSVVELLATILVTRSLTKVPFETRSLLISAVIGVLCWAALSFSQGYLVGAIGLLLTLFVLGAVGFIAIALSFVLTILHFRAQEGKVAYSFFAFDSVKVTGLSSYTESMLKALAAQDAVKGKVVFFTNMQGDLLEKFRVEGVTIVELSPNRVLPTKIYILWLHLICNIRAAWCGCSVYVSSTPSGSLLPVIKQFVTIHDLYDIDRTFRSFKTVLYSRIVWRLTAYVSRGIICVSETTKRDWVAFAPFSDKKSYVIAEASKFRGVEVREEDVNDRFLFVANVVATKNVSCLLDALAYLEKNGSQIKVEWIGRDANGDVGRWVARNGQLGNLVCRGSVDEQELMEAYRGATALIVCSLTEGFCLPVLEAHAFSVPVVASDIAILHEVAAQGALFFPPNDPCKLAECMVKISEDINLRQDLRKKAGENVGRFSWDLSAEKLLSVLCEGKERA